MQELSYLCWKFMVPLVTSGCFIIVNPFLSLSLVSLSISILMRFCWTQEVKKQHSRKTIWFAFCYIEEYLVGLPENANSNSNVTYTESTLILIVVDAWWSNFKLKVHLNLFPGIKFSYLFSLPDHKNLVEFISPLVRGSNGNLLSNTWVWRLKLWVNSRKTELLIYVQIYLVYVAYPSFFLSWLYALYNLSNLLLIFCRIKMPKTHVVHLGNSNELMEIAEDSVAKRILREHVRESLGVRNEDILFAIINSKPFPVVLLCITIYHASILLKAAFLNTCFIFSESAKG